jgi:hypothetical protein|nr:MAG TPA: protein of unknown function DUF603 [Caudoviricetes sp.]
MEWSEIVQNVLVPVGAFLGGGWILNFYNAKPKKNSIEIENMRTVIDELQDVIKQNTESSKEYRKTTTEEINALKKEVRELSLRVDIKHEAIYASSGCKFVKKAEDCIVMQTFKEKCQQCGINNN